MMMMMITMAQVAHSSESSVYTVAQPHEAQGVYTPDLTQVYTLNLTQVYTPDLFTNPDLFQLKRNSFCFVLGGSLQLPTK